MIVFEYAKQIRIRATKQNPLAEKLKEKQAKSLSQFRSKNSFMGNLEKN